jgi:hypothetical protein
MAKVFEYRQAEEIRDAFAQQNVKYLFIGKSGAILLGFPDTTQDADIYALKSQANGAGIVAALGELQFKLSQHDVENILRGKDFVQLKNGPFDLDLNFAPTGSNISTRRGSGTLKSMDFRCATLTTSLPASEPPIESRIANRSRGLNHFVSTGCSSIQVPEHKLTTPEHAQRSVGPRSWHRFRSCTWVFPRKVCPR